MLEIITYHTLCDFRAQFLGQTNLSLDLSLYERKERL